MERFHNFLQQHKDMEEQFDKVKEQIKGYMEATNVTKWETTYFTFRYTKGGEVARLDSKLLKETEPEIYSKYLSVSPRASSISYKLKE
jgi:hypothetical protein